MVACAPADAPHWAVMTTTAAPPTGPTTPLHRAAADGDLAAVREHLAAGHPPDPPDPEGHTPFLLACRQPEPDVFHALLAAGADFEAANVRKMAGLFLVATTGSASLARELIDRGADVNRPAARGLTPLVAAVLSENPRLVRLLLAAGADPRHVDDGGTSVLKWARQVAGKEVVELIRHPDRAADSTGPLALADLHLGAATGDVELIRDCLAAGVPADAPDGDGWTPLMVAARQGRRAAVQALLEAGASPYLRSPGGLTPVLFAAAHPNVLRQFAAAGVDLDHPGGTRGTTALAHAARLGFEDVVRFLLASGADPRRADRDGRTALDHATANGHRRVAELLREAKK